MTAPVETSAVPGDPVGVLVERDARVFPRQSGSTPSVPAIGKAMRDRRNPDSTIPRRPLSCRGEAPRCTSGVDFGVD